MKNILTIFNGYFWILSIFIAAGCTGECNTRCPEGFTMGTLTIDVSDQPDMYPTRICDIPQGNGNPCSFTGDSYYNKWASGSSPSSYPHPGGGYDKDKYVLFVRFNACQDYIQHPDLVDLVNSGLATWSTTSGGYYRVLITLNTETPSCEPSIPFFLSTINNNNEWNYELELTYIEPCMSVECEKNKGPCADGATGSILRATYLYEQNNIPFVNGVTTATIPAKLVYAYSNCNVNCR